MHIHSYLWSIVHLQIRNTLRLTRCSNHQRYEQYCYYQTLTVATETENNCQVGRHTTSWGSPTLAPHKWYSCAQVIFICTYGMYVTHALLSPFVDYACAGHTYVRVRLMQKFTCGFSASALPRVSHNSTCRRLRAQLVLACMIKYYSQSICQKWPLGMVNVALSLNLPRSREREDFKGDGRKSPPCC